MIEILAKSTVYAASAFLIGLALGAFFLPRETASFLNRFAGTAKAHFTEILLRLAVGVSIVRVADEMTFSAIFELFGWVLVVTSIILIAMPWQYHKKFAEAVVPALTKRVWLFGLLALPLGLAIAASLLVGVAK